MAYPDKKDKLFEQKGEDRYIGEFGNYGVETQIDDYAVSYYYTALGIIDNYEKDYKEKDCEIIQRHKKTELGEKTLVSCFLFRHYLELTLKSIYINYSTKTKDEKNNILACNHNLRNLWSYCKPLFESVCTDDDAENGLEGLENYLNQIANIDENSIFFRYPVNKKGELLHKQPIKINIKNLSECMKKCENFISDCMTEMDIKFK